MTTRSLSVASYLSLVGYALSGDLGAQVSILDVVNTEPGRRFYRAAPTGDVDGDGVPDVSVSGTGFGAVHSGATGARLHLFTTPAPAQTGLVIGTIDRVGDLDGDGCDDVVFGAPDEGPGGHVKVYSGKTGALLHDLVGDAPTTAGINFLGYEVVGLGDVNGDGTPDFGASRFTYVADEPPAIFVYSGVTGAAIFSNFDASGAKYPNIARAGDANGDGFADVLVAYTRSPEFDSCASVVELRSGQGGALLRSFEDPELCGDGAGLVGGADLDGDGYLDVIVGSTFGVWQGPYVTGIIKAYSGATGETLFVREGTRADGSMGASIAILGDIDLDGAIDVACGEPDKPTAAGTEAGVVHVFSAGSGPRFDVLLAGAEKDARFGTSLCVPGDLDDDGVADLAVTAPGPWSETIAEGTLTVHSLAGFLKREDRFVPGSSLRGAIEDRDLDDAVFAGLAGMKVELKFAVVGGDLAPRVRVTSADGEQSVVWSPKPGGVAKKTILLKRDGDYSLVVEGKQGTTGSYRVDTRWKGLGATPQSLLATVKGKNGKPPKVDFDAVAGTLVVGSVEALDGTAAPPSLELKTPTGGTTSLSPFVDPAEVGDNETWVDAVAAEESGRHVLAIVPGAGAPSKARFVFDLVTPRGRELLDID